MTRADLRQRATDIGVSRTVGIFLNHCDPFAPCVDFTARSWHRKLAYELWCAAKYVPATVGTLPRKFIRTAVFVADLPGVLPSFLTIAWSKARYSTLAAVLDHVMRLPRWLFSCARSRTASGGGPAALDSSTA